MQEDVAPEDLFGLRAVDEAPAFTFVIRLDGARVGLADGALIHGLEVGSMRPLGPVGHRKAHLPTSCHPRQLFHARAENEDFVLAQELGQCLASNVAPSFLLVDLFDHAVENLGGIRKLGLRGHANARPIHTWHGHQLLHHVLAAHLRDAHLLAHHLALHHATTHGSLHRVASKPAQVLDLANHTWPALTALRLEGRLRPWHDVATRELTPHEEDVFAKGLRHCVRGEEAEPLLSVE
mmetsp:Transcript_63022/g.117904  ORF Transcript_63022/g.117904 Transcript_63022/m.117904 type:complete len:237 (-) Transcript_63022:297-1007(-)